MNIPFTFNGTMLLGVQSITASDLNGPFQIAVANQTFEPQSLGPQFESLYRVGLHLLSVIRRPKAGDRRCSSLPPSVC